MTTDIPGVLAIQDTGGSLTRISLDGDTAAITTGGAPGVYPEITIEDEQGKPRIRIGASLWGKQPNQFWVWGVSVMDSSGAHIVDLGPLGRLNLGGLGASGTLNIQDKNNIMRIRAFGDDGEVLVNDAGGSVVISLSADQGISCRQYIEDAVAGESAGAYKSGVYGVAGDPNGYGVSGRNTRFDCFGALGARVLPHGPGETFPYPMGCGVYGLARYPGPGSEDTVEATGIRGVGEDGAIGVLAMSDKGTGLVGISQLSLGVEAQSQSGTGLFAFSRDSFAGQFWGDVEVSGQFSASIKNCKIDHPLDPENKYLIHACVESSERLNIYQGSVQLNGEGEAVIELPEWVQAFNTSFEYHLTPVGAAAPNLHVAEEVNNNRFRIAGGSHGIRVSWQITGVRGDAYAVRHPMQVEVQKEGSERGTYLHPAEHGAPETARFDPRQIRLQK